LAFQRSDVGVWALTWISSNSDLARMVVARSLLGGVACAGRTASDAATSALPAAVAGEDAAALSVHGSSSWVELGHQAMAWLSRNSWSDSLTVGTSVGLSRYRGPRTWVGPGTPAATTTSPAG
jgi:hypothetical protein